MVSELNRLKKLPTIIFIFSRAGCEQSAKMVTQSDVNLLSSDEVNYVSRAISLFAEKNPEIPVSKQSVCEYVVVILRFLEGLWLYLCSIVVMFDH
mgnify:CR=1 FL=1